MLTQVMVTTTILGIITPTVFRISMVPAITAAQNANFQKAELQATMFLTSAVSKNQLPPVPPQCELTTNDAETFTYTILCKEGSTKQTTAKASRSFTLLSPDASSAITVSGLGVYSDDDRDGFDDVTGLFTHYAECYSGWKGQGTLKNNCELGGPFVIKAYAHLYN